MRPRVLFLTHRMPYPPNRGDRIRAYHMLKFLSEHADVLLGSVADEPWESGHEGALRDLCEDVSIHRLPPRGRWVRAAAGMATGKSATAGAFYSRGLARQVREWTQGSPLDAAIVYCSSMGPYCRSFTTRPRKVLVDLVDVDSQKWLDYATTSRGWKRLLYRHEAQRVRGLERRLSLGADAVSVVSSDEAALFRSRHRGLDAHAISNGVDHDYFAPEALTEQAWIPHRHGKPQMVFVGVLDYLPNIQGLQWFCDHVLPSVLKQYPGALLEIVGRRPVAAVLEMGKRVGVRLVGEVEDVRPHILASDFAIAPLQIARGIQNKVLEALACGRPVLATSQAATGIDSRGGLLVSDSPASWLESIRRLQCTHEHADQRALARRGILEQYSWPARLSPLLGMLELGDAKQDPTRNHKILVD